MKKLLLLFSGIILTINCYSQIDFEQGYFINNSDQKIDCLIKNNDWRNNPTSFEYKLSEESEKKKETIEGVKEFGVTNESKYVRADVKIDRSSADINRLSREKHPLFSQEELFLKVLIEGKANLYLYQNGDIRKYFYSVENANIEQLVFKLYQSSVNAIRENNHYQQQLWTDLKCPEIKMSDVERLEYNKGSLVKFFIRYNQCYDSTPINYEKKERSDFFNLTLRPRLRYSSLKTKGASFFRQVDFGYNLGFGFGVEAEFILPFNKNKWAVIIEPTYQRLKAKTITDRDNIPGEVITSTVKYNSIEIPIGVRHYIFLNDNSKIFINAAAILDISINSSLDFNRADGTTIDPLKLRSFFNLALGAGYKMNDKYSLELRYLSNRDLLIDYASSTNHHVFSIIFGYTLF